MDLDGHVVEREERRDEGGHREGEQDEGTAQDRELDEGEHHRDAQPDPGPDIEVDSQIEHTLRQHSLNLRTPVRCRVRIEPLSAVLRRRSRRSAVRGRCHVDGHPTSGEGAPKALCLTFEFHVQLSTEDDRVRGEEEPQHQHNHRTQSPIHLVVVAEAGVVDREPHRGE